MGTDRYTIISADGHAGAELEDYRSYLDSKWHADFDAWAATFVNPYADLEDPTRVRNWDSELRREHLEADGIVAEVLFPNTIPPFFPTSQLVVAPPTEAAELEQRWAGLHAHNRWLVDFCAALPGRRAGLAQVFVNDVPRAVEEIEWAAEQGLSGVLVPAIPPDVGLEALWHERYDPIWAACQHHDLTITQHGGAGSPNVEGATAHNFLMLMEIPFFANRSLWHLILGGVFDRFPQLRFVMTEQAVDWVPITLMKMDYFWQLMTEKGCVGQMPADEQLLPHKPSTYFNRNCWMGSSFPSPAEAEAIVTVGTERVMWGGDYPHREGTYPHSIESLQNGFHTWDSEIMHDVLARNAANVYKFDYAALDALSDEQGIGPAISTVATPLAELPDNPSMAFNRP